MLVNPWSEAVAVYIVCTVVVRVRYEQITVSVQVSRIWILSECAGTVLV